jgi:hypothetical protein
MIISLHTPKAGGSSFKKILEDEFQDSFLSDYKDKPINNGIEKRISDVEKYRKKIKYIYAYYYDIKGVKCIHGHFLPFKYDYYLNKPNVKFITWLREPLERLASHYYYWFRSYDKRKSGDLHRKVVENKWTFEQFAFSEEMKNFYKQFLYNFNIEDFDFIGITEFFEEDLNYFFENYLNKKISFVPNNNINANKIGEYYNDPLLINELRDFHSLDYVIYNFALQKRKNRLNDFT